MITVGQRIGRNLPALLLLIAITVVSLGCSSPKPVTAPPPPPDYTRPLAPGAPSLRLLAASDRPDLSGLEAQFADPTFRESLRRSAGWYAKPSSKTYFSPERVATTRISHGHADVSARALLWIVEHAASPAEAIRQVQRDFDVYQSVGWNGRGDVLITGYFSPEFTASLTRTGAFQYPLYARPADLRSDPISGEVFGRQSEAGIVPYHTRSQIEGQGLLAGTELVYLPSRLDAYTIEVNGSAKLKLTDGSVMYIGHAGTNGLEYTSIGRELIHDGKLDKNTVSMPTIRRFFLDNPDQLELYIARNDRFVFFQEYDNADDWPGGSLGFRVEGMRSIATDKEVYPAGAVVLVQTGSNNRDGAIEPINQLVMDQDTGGAIRAPGRADLYFGIGSVAEEKAGRLAIEGRLYYLFLKRELVQGWYNRLRAQ
ncbi:MAG: MltA domain-containing protein [Planctomycetota bacterium]